MPRSAAYSIPRSPSPPELTVAEGLSSLDETKSKLQRDTDRHNRRERCRARHASDDQLGRLFSHMERNPADILGFMAELRSSTELRLWMAERVNHPRSESIFDHMHLAVLDHLNLLNAQWLSTNVPTNHDSILEIGFGGSTEDFGETCTFVVRGRSIDKPQLQRHNMCEDLPLNAESVDVVYLMCCFGLWPDIVRGIHEAFRVLKPSGKFITSGKHCAAQVLFKEHTTEVKHLFGDDNHEEHLEFLRELGVSPIENRITVPSCGALQYITADKPQQRRARAPTALTGDP